MVLAIPQRQTPIVTWDKLPEDFILLDDPVQNIQHPSVAAGLTDALGGGNRIQR